MITREQAIAGSRDDKKIYKINQNIPHENLKIILAEIEPLMQADLGLSVIVVVGPTGVGKTSLGRLILRKTLEKYSILIQEDPSVIPAVMVEVDSPDRKHEIDFGLFFARVCQALVAPGVLDGFSTPLGEDGVAIDYVQRSRAYFERAVAGRGLEHLILDEVIHFLASSTTPEHYGNLLKSLSNRSRFDLLLLGAYGSEELVHASGQLARRVVVLHYPRYKECDIDFNEYATFIKSVAAAMPYPFEIDVENDIEYLFTGNFGITGSSVDVLYEAAARCSLDKHPTWNRKKLEKSMPSVESYKSIVRETLLGEGRIQPYLQGGRVVYPTEKEMREILKKEQQQHNKSNRNPRR